MILAIHFLIPSKRNELDGIASEIIYDIYSYNGSEEERKLFQQEWETAKSIVLKENKMLNDAYQKHGFLKKNSFDEWQNLLKNGSKPDVSLLIKDCALILEHIKRKFKRCVSLDIIPDECKNVILPPVHCEPNKRYRNIDGSCNNLINPRWGMYGASFLRHQKAHYADDVSQIRESVHGIPLPNVRLLSNKLYSRKTLPDANTTMLLMNFGLLLDHDVVRSGQAADAILSCCSPEILQDPDLRHPLCLEIEVPESDVFYGPLNVSCLNFVRDSPAVGICP
ncbi:Chorion peroxidase, partial [Stegodyphus mimosarum]